MNTRHLIAAACLATAGLLGTAIPAADAAPPEDFTVPIEFSFSFDDCGFVVDFTATGSLRITLWRNDAGLVARERDAGVGYYTWTNAETGKTISTIDPSSYWWDYGSGAVLGSTAKVTGTGMFGRLPGSGPEAGRVVGTAIVVGFSPEGIPFVEPSGEDPSFVAGRHPDADICAALG